MRDRISQAPGRVLVKPENGGAQFYATLERADNPIQEGDALNKANLLKDETAALLGLSENAVPDDAFASLGWHIWKRRAEEAGYDVVIGEITSVSFKSTKTSFYYLHYASSYTENADGTLSLNDPTTVEMRYGGSYPSSDTLQGKYIVWNKVQTNGGNNVEAVYYVESDGALSYTQSDTTTTFTITNTKKYELQYHENIGEYEYVTSPNRHAYPDSGREGIFTYEYLGSPLENAKEAYGMRLHWWKRETENGEYEYLSSPDRNAYPDSGTEGIFSYQYLGVPFENAREGAKVVTGSYVGTNTYGVSNPNSLTFDFEPKMLLIIGTSVGSVPSLGLWVKGSSLQARAANTLFINTTTLSGNTISWYVDNANQQLNNSSYTYYYTAIG